MNERIAELRMKAQELAAEAFPGDVPFDPNPNPILWDRIHISYEKFAELIVQECIDVGLEQKKWVEDQTVFNESDEVWNRARTQQSQHIVDKIKQHFGVE